MTDTYRNMAVTVGITFWLTCCVVAASMSTNHGWQPTSATTAGPTAAAIASSITNGWGAYAGLTLLAATFITGMFGTRNTCRYFCRTLVVATTITTAISTFQGYVPWMMVLIGLVASGFDITNKLYPDESTAEKTPETA